MTSCPFYQHCIWETHYLITLYHWGEPYVASIHKDSAMTKHPLTGAHVAGTDCTFTASSNSLGNVLFPEQQTVMYDNNTECTRPPDSLRSAGGGRERDPLTDHRVRTGCGWNWPRYRGVKLATFHFPRKVPIWWRHCGRRVSRIHFRFPVGHDLNRSTCSGDFFGNVYFRFGERRKIAKINFGALFWHHLFVSLACHTGCPRPPAERSEAVWRRTMCHFTDHQMWTTSSWIWPGY